jgi:ABC-type sugar transport system substrate-binding protein
MDDPTWAVVEAAAKRCEEQDRFSTIDVMAPETHSPREQRELLLGLLEREVDVVCVLPTDVESVRSVIDRLAQNGIPVVTIGRDVPGSNRRAYCGPIEAEIGRAAAQACVAAVQGRPGTVMLLHAGTDTPVYGERYQGFQAGLRPQAGLRILRAVDCGGSRSDAVRLVRLESRKYPRVGCWVFLEDWPLRAVSASERLLPNQCGIVLCNGSPRYFDWLRDGRIVAMITHDLQRTLKEGMLAAVQLADPRWREGEFALDYTAEVETVTAKNLAGHEARWKTWAEQGSED